LPERKPGATPQAEQGSGQLSYMSISEYRRKRDFSKTLEPPPAAKPKKAADAHFVIQKHAASRLHFDFRLEMGGVFKSWAVPKGMPYRHGDKRLAVRTEDHPVEYGGFEGIIPAGEYGAGTVMIWDRGSYSVSGGQPLKSLENGKLHMELAGEKLKGEWTLVRTRGGSGSDQESWLLMKTGESVRSPGKRREERSASSGRTMGQIASEKTAAWQSNVEAVPVFHEPMRAKAVERLPAEDGWLYEIKFDGYRALAIKNGKEAHLFSRNEKPLEFPELSGAVAGLPCRSAVLDGEIVALDSDGHPSFQLLQARDIGTPAPIVYYLFDLLTLDGTDCRGESIHERRRRLAALLATAKDSLRVSPALPGRLENVLAEIRKLGLEGVVAKKVDSRYRSGAATGDWLKLKCLNEQEFVIGGYAQSDKRGLASVLVGYYERSRLHFAGRVGSGFSELLLAQLGRLFQGIRTESPPFADIQPVDARGAAWVRPELVCQVRFSEWTRDGRLRQPVFLGLRDDKSPMEVRRE